MVLSSNWIALRVHSCQANEQDCSHRERETERIRQTMSKDGEIWASIVHLVSWLHLVNKDYAGKVRLTSLN